MTAARITYEPPMACCHAAQWVSRFPPVGNHHCGAAARTASSAAAPARTPRCRSRRPPIARTSSAGSAHTQWCDQEIGDISSAARALSDSARAWADRATACRMPYQDQYHHEGRQRQPRGRFGRGARIEPGADEERLDGLVGGVDEAAWPARSEEHTSELQSP